MENQIYNHQNLQLVSFCLEDEEFAINILQVKEINRYIETMKIPKAASFIEGIIKLREQIIPIINLRHRFRYQARKINEDSRIIIVEVKGQTVGFIVDSVKEVMRISQDSIDEAPEMFTSQAAKYMAGVCKLDERLILLLNLDKVFSRYELEALKKAA